MGDYLSGRLRTLANGRLIGQVRGKGLLIGLELVADQETKEPFDPRLGVARRVYDAAFRRGLLVQPGAGCVDGVRGDHVLICPPLIVSKAEADRIIEILEEALQEVEGLLASEARKH